jgi:hypothetical protein
MAPEKARNKAKAFAMTNLRLLALIGIPVVEPLADILSVTSDD